MMNEAVKEHTEVLIGELMRSLKIQEELLRELSRMTSAVLAASADGKGSNKNSNSVIQWKSK